MPLEVFQAPATLREQLIEFQARQPCHPLTELDHLKDELAGYVGIYLLYLTVFRAQCAKSAIACEPRCGVLRYAYQRQ